MAVKYALEQLYTLVQAQILADWGDDTHVVVEWGQKAVALQTNVGTVGRIVIVPGDERGDFGEFTGAEQWEQPAKALDTLQLPFRVYVYGYDRTKPEHDIHQDHIAFGVLHEAFRAIKLAQQNWDQNPLNRTSTVRFGHPRQIKPQAQFGSGKEFVWVCTIEQPFLDSFNGELEYVDVAPAIGSILETLGEHSDTATTETTDNAS